MGYPPRRVNPNHLVVLGCAVAIAACAPAAPSPVAPAPPARVLDDASVADVIARVTSLRKLTQVRPIRVTILGRDAFFERFLADNPPPDDEARARRERFVVGLDFASPGHVAPTREEIVKAAYGGFYDPPTDMIYLPREDVATDVDGRSARRTLAHEVEHALQAQHFSEPSRRSEPIAWQSLLEGDAKFTELAYAASERGVPVSRVLREYRDDTAGAPVEAFRKPADARVLGAVLPLDGQHIVFPYRAGTRFVTELYRAGGLSLVDSAFAAPPTTSEHILHPETFLRGESPRPVGTPDPPPGDTLVASGVLGELDARILLERCHAYGDAERGAAGWNGDRYAVFTAPDRTLDVVWISAWDTESDARDFESLVGAEACWRGGSAAGPAGSIGGKRAIVRRGSVVVFMRGDRASDDAAERLVENVGDAPPAVQFSALTIPPLRPLPAPVKGQLDANIFRSAWLGIRGEAPPSFDTRPGKPSEQTSIVARRGTSHAELAVSERIFDDAQNADVFAHFEEDLRSDASEHSLTLHRAGGGPITTPLGEGVEQWYRFDASAWSVGVVLVPICGGAASLSFMVFLDRDSDRPAVDQWIQSFRRTGEERAPACEYLDPT